MEYLPRESSENQEEFYEHYRINTDTGQSPLRIDKFLVDRLPNTSRNRIQNAAKAGCILVNKTPVKSNHKVKPGEEISVVLSYPPRDKEIKPEHIPLDIVYEDPWLLVVNKPAGMVVHPGISNYSGTLVNALTWHFGELKAMDNDKKRPGLVHRIDKDTSGLLLIAKDEVTLTHLANQFYHHTVERTYQGLVWGNVSQNEGVITGNLARSKRDRKIMQVYEDENTGKHAVTHYRVLERFGYATLMEFWLETGRTHQIRAHMKYAGHPVFGDEAYGGTKIIAGPSFTKFRQFVNNALRICSRQALHAYSLGFYHPEKKNKIYFEKQPPEDMEELLKKWRNYAYYKGI